jgi:hypothetical protein
MGKVAIMLDIESLDLGPRSITTQVGMIAFSVDDPETEIRRIEAYLPVQPQVTLGRTFSWDTLMWWMSQDEKARAHFIENSGNDMEELLALVRSIHRKMSELIRTAGGKNNVELWARGPQFDVVNLETLMVDCGLTPPWAHDSVMDLRSTMRLAGIRSEDVDSSGIVQHVAMEDCKFQIRCYIEAMKHIRAKS